MNKRLLIVGNFLSSSNGSRCVCEELVPRLTNAGWQVLYASRKPSRVARLTDMLCTVWRHRAEFDVAQVDVYSGSAFRWAEATCWLLRRLRKPFVLTLHGGALPQFALRYPKRVNRLLSSGYAVTAPSRYLLETMRPWRPDIVLVPNPIKIDDYPFHPRPNSKPRLVWLRAFQDLYNPYLAVRVLAAVAERFADATLLMVGPDKGDGSLQRTQRLADELGVADRCRFQGKVPKPEVAYWLNQGDVFLNTSDVDNTPVSVLEALACGLCVVSTNVGGIPYLLTDQHDACLVPRGDCTAMVAAIQQFHTLPSLSAKLSVNARRTACAFDWSIVLPKWESLLRDAAGMKQHSTLAVN